MRPHASWCIALALGLAAGAAQAQKAGDWVVGAGALTYAPHDKTSPLELVSPVQQVFPGTGANVRNATTLGLNLHYFVTDNWAVEAVFGIPPRIRLDGSGTLAPVGRLGDARLYSPALLGKYFFGRSDDRFRVSAGLGLTYAAFRSVRLTPGLQGVMGGALGIPPGASATSGRIGSKLAPVFSVGANYAIDTHWGVAFSLSWIPMKTTATLTTRVGGNTVGVARTRVRLDPVVPYLYLTYRF